MASELSTNKPVCVTGASGFIASRLVADLLSAGYEVRGTVRDACDSEKYEFLTSLDGADERLTLVSGNLLDPKSFDEAIKGCEVVMHTASPYTMSAKDPQKELVDPALMGTLGVLQSCTDVGGVKRVVLTSSFAAITDEPDADVMLNEEHWNEKSSLTRNPYYFSKVQAEKAAWKYVEDSAAEFSLVTINPSMVFGPSLVESLNTSNQVIADLLNGKVPGIVNLAWSMVDVRDVSRAHILAMETPEASGRFLCAFKTVTMREMVTILRELGFEDYKLPKMSLDNAFGNVMARVSSIFRPPGVRSYLKTNLGRIPSTDNSKIKRDLGLEFRDFGESLKDAVTDMKTWGHVASKS